MTRADLGRSAVADRLRRALSAHSQGRLDDAARLYEQVLRRWPDDPRARYGLGEIALRRQQPLAAVAHLQRAVSAALAKRDRLAVLVTLARAHTACGQLEEACRSYRAAIEIAPRDAGLHRALGLALGRAGRALEALDALHRCLDLGGEDAATRVELGHLLADGGDAESAEREYARALQLDPGCTEAHNALGNLHESRGRLEEAIVAYRRAIELRPELPALYGNLANALKFQGRLGEAAEAVRSALRQDPRFARGYYSLVELDTSGLSEAECDRMIELAGRADLSEQDRVYLSFALARAYEIRGEFDQAFDWLEAGNRIVRNQIELDVADDEAWVDDIIEIFDASFVDARSSAGCDSAAPVFIVGMPRSGSTLVERILGRHSQIGVGGELTALQRCVGELAAGRPEGPRCYQRVVGDWQAVDARWQGLGETYLTAVAEVLPAEGRFTDKMLSNFLFIGLIGLALPRARIVHTLRDPLDVCLACYRQLFATTQHFAFDLGDLGRYYRLYDRLMHHWRTVIPGRILDLQYERLVQQPDAVVAELLDHCGLQWEAACLRPEDAVGPVKTASAVQVRRPIHGESIGRWRNYRHRLGPLRAALGPLAEGGLDDECKGRGDRLGG